MTIRRVDLESAVLTREVVDGRADFSEIDGALAPGGTHGATAVGRSVLFQVDSKARRGPGPIIGRLPPM